MAPWTYGVKVGFLANGKKTGFAMAKTTRGSDKLIVRVPDGMRDRIKAGAAKRGVSMNSEIVRCLEIEYPPLAGETFGEFLTFERQSKGLTIEELSARSGVYPDFIYALENEELVALKLADVRLVKAVTRALDVSDETLLIALEDFLPDPRKDLPDREIRNDALERPAVRDGTFDKPPVRDD
jgi:transcriptional regulator with XRE-family HTH domain